MNQLTVEKIVKEIDAIHRDFAKLSVDQLQGTPSALKTGDIIQLHPIPVAENTVAFLRRSLIQADTAEERARIERVLFGCMDLAVGTRDCFVGGHAEILHGTRQDARRFGKNPGPGGS